MSHKQLIDPNGDAGLPLLSSSTEEHQVILSMDGNQKQSPAKQCDEVSALHQADSLSDVTDLVDVVRCPVCKANTFRNEFTRSGITLALLFFPVGLLFCILLTEKRCDSCGYKA